MKDHVDGLSESEFEDVSSSASSENSDGNSKEPADRRNFGSDVATGEEEIAGVDEELEEGNAADKVESSFEENDSSNE